MLVDIKGQLVKSQDLMKNNADKHRRDLVFEVGALVYLKLCPYRQNSGKMLLSEVGSRYLRTRLKCWRRSVQLHII